MFLQVKNVTCGKKLENLSLYQIHERKFEEDPAPLSMDIYFYWSPKDWLKQNNVSWIEKQNVSVPEKTTSQAPFSLTNCTIDSVTWELLKADEWPPGSCEQESWWDPWNGSRSLAQISRGAPGLLQERSASARPCSLWNRHCHFVCIILCSPSPCICENSDPHCGVQILLMIQLRCPCRVIPSLFLPLLHSDLQLPSVSAAQPNPPAHTYL